MLLSLVAVVVVVPAVSRQPHAPEEGQGGPTLVQTKRMTMETVLENLMRTA
jgi:hypothetical protein